MPEYTLTGSGGVPIAARVWETSATPRALVVISHGFGEHAGRYAHVAERLNAEGYLVVAPDHRGHGRSGGARGQLNFATAVADLDAVFSSQAEIHPTLPAFLLGHSAGGAVALRYALAHQDRLRGLILSAPLVLADANPVVKAAAGLIAKLAPGAPVVKLDPALVSRDPTVVDAYQSDPLVRHAPIPAATGVEFVRHADTIMADARRITVPTLLMWGSADGLCPAAGAEQLARSLGATDLSTRAFDGLYHEIFNEPERDEVLDVLVGWLAAHT